MASDIDFSARRGGLARQVGGIAAFAYPLALTSIALSVGFRRAGDMSDLATSLLATMLFLVAAPTAWIFTVDFIEAGRLLIISSALATSLPLWFLVGSRLAYFSYNWSTWLRRYVLLCVVWSVINTLVIVVVGSIAG